MAKFRDEGAIYRALVTSQQRELDDLHAIFLLQQQLSFEAQLKEREERELYEEQIAEFKDKLDRKDFFMQNKKRKWLEIAPASISGMSRPSQGKYINTKSVMQTYRKYPT